MKSRNRSICQMAQPCRPIPVLVCMIIICSFGNVGSALHLSGVTSSPDHPRAQVWDSFFHALIDEIGAIGQFSYNLRTVPGAKHGGAVGERIPEGLVGEVYGQRADFVLVDLEITTEREKFIEFTRPFLRSKLAALVRRHPPPANQSSANGANGDNKDKSSDDNDQTATSDTSAASATPSGDTLRSLLQKNKRGVVRGSLTERYFRTSNNSRVYHLIPSGESTLRAGVQLVNNNADYVFVSDSARLDLIAAHECQFRVATPVEGNPEEIGNDFVVEYAIGLVQDSPFLVLFDAALEQLELSGKLQALIDTHWADECNPKSNADEETNGASSLAPLWWIGTITALTITSMLTSRAL